LRRNGQRLRRKQRLNYESNYSYDPLRDHTPRRIG
jgi:hypothetical protein